MQDDKAEERGRRRDEIFREFKHIATVLSQDPCDERTGVWMSNEDWKKLEKLYPGTRLYIWTGP